MCRCQETRRLRHRRALLCRRCSRAGPPPPVTTQTFAHASESRLGSGHFGLIVLLCARINLGSRLAVVPGPSWSAVFSRISLKRAQHVTLHITERLFEIVYMYMCICYFSSFQSIRTSVSLWSRISLQALEAEKEITDCVSGSAAAEATTLNPALVYSATVRLH